MARLFYFVKTALRGIRRSPLRSVLCTATTGVALAVLGSYLLLYVNLETLLASWGSDLDLSVYLKDDISVQARERLGEKLRLRPEVSEVRYVDRADAALRLRREWPQHAELLAAAGDIPTEASFELRLGPVRDLRVALGTLSRELLGEAGVAATDYGERELARVEVALELLRSAGAVLAAILALAAMFMIGATVRLAIRERRDELEIMRLCGATNAFIRAPLYLEGALQGVIGGVLALGLVFLLHAFLEGAVDDVFSAARPGQSALSFLSLELSFALVGGATVLGGLGSAVAAGRYLRT